MDRIRFLSCALALLVTSPLCAEDIRGTLLRVSPDKQEIAVDVRLRGGRGQTTAITLTIDKDTQILLGRRQVGLADLPVGKRVRVLYEVQNGRQISRSVIGPPVIGPEVIGVIGNIAGNSGIPKVKEITDMIGAIAGNAGGLPQPKSLPAPNGGTLPGTLPSPREATTPNGAVPSNGGTLPGPRDLNGGGDAFSGVLRRVARTDREVVVVWGGANGRQEQEATIFVPADARVLRDGKATSLDDLKEGENAVVHAQTKDGKRIATEVAVGRISAEISNNNSQVPVIAPEAAQAPAQDGRITKIRQVLQMIDGILGQFE